MEEKKYWFFVQKGRNPHQIVYCTITDEEVNINGGGSRSQGYDTKELLIEGEKILAEPCQICGDYVETNYSHGSELVKRGICFLCNFWYEIEKTLNDPRRFIIDGESYWRKDDAPAGTSFVGYGGHEFHIQRIGSNEIITTKNLWHQGVISEAFKTRIPNNAIFINHKKQ